MFANTINPILLSLGPLTIRWYGVFLALGVLATVLVLQHLFTKQHQPKELAYDLAIWLTVGGLIGARLGHAIFYNATYFLANPLEIFFINHGGLASHGMIIGIIVSLLLFIKKKKILLSEILDPLAVSLPLLALFIRLGNFFNSEIVGNITTLPWGVHFARIDAEIVYRHPVQLYESLLGIAIFAISYTLYKRYKIQVTNKKQISIFKQPYGITALVILLYFSGRFMAEFFKARHILEGSMSMGQWLSLPFILASIVWFAYAYRKNLKPKT